MRQEQRRWTIFEKAFVVAVAVVAWGVGCSSGAPGGSAGHGGSGGTPMGTGGAGTGGGAAGAAGIGGAGTGGVPTGGSSSGGMAGAATGGAAASGGLGTAGKGGSAGGTAGAAGKGMGAAGAPGTGGGAGGAGAEPTGIFVAVGYGGRRIRSLDDGRTWIDDVALVAHGGDDDTLLRSVTWGQGQFVAVGYRVITSPDGKTWQDHGVNNLGQWLGSILAAKTGWVALGGYGLRATSADALTWKDHSVDNIAMHGTYSLAYDAEHDHFASVNDGGSRHHSADGVTWSASTGATSSKSVQLVAGNGLVVGLGNDAIVVSSDGGATWASAGQLGANVRAAVFAQGHFTVLAQGGHAFTSSNGKDWTDHGAGKIDPNGLAYGHGTYVCIDGSYGLARSTDGTTWQPTVQTGTMNSYQVVAFGPAD